MTQRSRGSSILQPIWLVATIFILFNCDFCGGFCAFRFSQYHKKQFTIFHGWLDNFLPSPVNKSGDDSERRKDYPEQYPATYEESEINLPSDDVDDIKEEALLVRPLLKQTMLEKRALQKVYDARIDGWDAGIFHQKVDGKGAAIVIATYFSQEENVQKIVGGYNPKGWSSNGGARPSVASFLFYETTKTIADATTIKSTKSISQEVIIQKLRKCGGGGLACTNDVSEYGISFGPDALVIPLQQTQSQQLASSKLGPYFEKGPEEISSLFINKNAVKLESLVILTGVYDTDEEIPYSGAVMDMTSG